MSTDRERGEIICTLCRCKVPSLHGDAYTMLESYRGNDIYGSPIDWQESKRRMLDRYRRDQISHAEEIDAILHIFDKATADHMLENERRKKEAILQGAVIDVNVEGNNTDWHNPDVHAKRYMTEEGAKTQFHRR
ncbi:hypothetical protein EK21DRAFT_114966 [Setomelanomma holmii]|uniref:Uncharacterized protein n=1 Tax=Setomelanomma holmii TaxID=210430 RepID=A0A9P4H4Z7_9PLEO|nr:hypothetical protein EK21DRAFT_114966 [Setomelanomma holmii]